MNNFDWLVTVAMGSMAGSGILLSTVPAGTAIVAIGVLLALQYGVTKLSFHVHFIDRLVRAQPTLLLYKGELLPKNMAAERVTRQEVMSAVRDAGVRDCKTVHAVVLENDASLSVIVSGQPGQTCDTLSHLDDIKNQES